jgi:hypothetical protein
MQPELAWILDELYDLNGVAGIWHEQRLSAYSGYQHSQPLVASFRTALRINFAQM